MAVVIAIIVIVGLLWWNSMAQEECDARDGQIVWDRGQYGAVGECVEPVP